MATKLRTGNFSTEQLNQLVARIERLEEEKKALADDIKEVYAEAKAHGFDIKILRQVVRLRKIDKADLAEQENLLQVYMDALGMEIDRSPTELETAAASVTKTVKSLFGKKDGVKVELRGGDGNLIAAGDGKGNIISGADQAAKGVRGAGLVGQIHDKLVEAGMQHLGGTQYAPAGSPAAEIAALADERGVSPEVKDLAIRTARLAETDPRGAKAVVTTVHALAGGNAGEASAAPVAPSTQTGGMVSVSDLIAERVYSDAVAMVRQNPAGTHIPLSVFQRQLRLSFNGAARIVERLEAGGVLSAPDEGGKRTVLPFPGAVAPAAPHAEAAQ